MGGSATETAAAFSMADKPSPDSVAGIDTRSCSPLTVSWDAVAGGLVLIRLRGEDCSMAGGALLDIS